MGRAPGVRSRPRPIVLMGAMRTAITLKMTGTTGREIYLVMSSGATMIAMTAGMKFAAIKTKTIATPIDRGNGYQTRMLTETPAARRKLTAEGGRAFCRLLRQE